MAEKSGIFNAVADSSGNYDREYLAEDFAAYFSRFITNGVFPNPSTGLQVTAAPSPNMTVLLQPGYGYIDGYTYENTAAISFDIGVADGVLNRKDAIIIRWDKAGRVIKAYKIQGNPGASAVAPSPVRTADYYDLCVAIVNVNAGATTITQAAIEDTRMDTAICGIVTGAVTQVDTTTLYNQIQSDLNQFKTVNEADFQAWFATIKDILDADTAGHLLNLIDDLDDTKADKVANATEGNLPSLDSSGNLVDSGIPKTKAALKPRKVSISLTAAGWTGAESPYTQVVSIPSGTTNDVVDLQPDDATIMQVVEDGVLALKVDNVDGVFTAKAFSNKPSVDITLQATLTEVM